MKAQAASVWLVLLPLWVLAQSPKIDSLWQVVAATRVDSLKGRSLSVLCYELCCVGAFDAALEAGQRGLALCRRAGDSLGAAHCHNTLGIVYLNKGDLTQALKHFEADRRIHERLGKPAALAIAAANIGNIYLEQGAYAKALNAFQQSLKAFERAGDQANVARILDNIGAVFQRQSDFDRALQYWKRSREIFTDLNDSLSIAINLTNVGSLHFVQGNYRLAVACNEQALRIKEHIGYRLGIPTVLINLGTIYYKQGEFARALDYYKQAHQILVELGAQSSLAACLSHLSDTYFELRRYAEAALQARKGLTLAQETGNLEAKKDCANALCRADSALGNWQGAFTAHRLYKIYADSLKNDQQSKEIGRLEAQYEADKERERLEARQQAELLLHNWYLGSSLGGLVLVAVIAFILFRGRQREKHANTALRNLNSEIQQQKAEIEAQRDQLNAANERLHELDRMKEQLTGMIVHDLKNPLNAVLAMAALPPDAERMNIIRGAGQQMSQLVLDLLDVQKYEEASLVLKLELTSAVELIRRAAGQTDFLAHQKQIVFDVRVDARLLVEADAELIVRVLVNLLTNAIKYAPAGDRIEIEVCFDEGRGAVFRVTDHGRGIPADQLERIFEKFGQVGGGEASGQLRSTGLGLTFCRLTVEAHGGRIDVRSAVGRYTTFEFNLPRAKQTETGELTVTQRLGLPAEPVELSAAYRAAHAGALAALVDLPLHLISDLADVLEDLPETEAGVAAWKDAVMVAALAGNAAAYRALVEGSVPEGDS